MMAVADKGGELFQYKNLGISLDQSLDMGKAAGDGEGDGTKGTKSRREEDNMSVLSSLSSAKGSEALSLSKNGAVTTDTSYLAKLPKYVMKHRFRGQKVL